MQGADELGLRERKKLETWRAIRAAAVRLMTERDYGAVGVEEIAAAAQVSKRTLFNYFASKEAILFDPDPADSEIWQEILTVRPPGEAPWLSMQEALLAYLDVAGERMAVQRRLVATTPAFDAFSRALGERVWSIIRAWWICRVPAGTSPLQVELTVNLARAVLHTCYRQWDPDEGVGALKESLREAFALAGTLTEHPRPDGKARR